MSSNGNMTTAELSPIAGGIPGPDPGQGQLADAAAAAWNAMAAEVLRERGAHLTVNGPDSAYRPLSRQWYYWNLYQSGQGNLAAYPGTSNHGLGLAGDLPTYVQALVDAYGAKYGWDRLRCSDALSERWHYKWCGGWSGSDPGAGGDGRPRYPTLSHGDHGPAVKRAQRHLRRWNLGITRPAADGGFGDVTRRAAREFQIVHALKPDGVIGKITWSRLRLVDHFLDDERRELNDLRLVARRHPHPNRRQRREIRRRRVWCARRARSIRAVAQDHGWGDQHRAQRFRQLRKAAAGLYDETHL